MNKDFSVNSSLLKRSRLSRHTFHVQSVSRHDASAQHLLNVNPSLVNLVGASQGKPLRDVDRATIYSILQQNSQAFLKQERQHIDGFRKAQSIQKKNLDWMISSNSSIQLAPLKPTMKGHFTQRAFSLGKPSNANTYVVSHNVSVAFADPPSQQEQPL